MIEILFLVKAKHASMKAAKCEQIYVSSNDGPTGMLWSRKKKKYRRKKTIVG